MLGNFKNNLGKTKSESISKADVGLKFLIFYSVGMYLFEMVQGTANSLESPAFFLWSERIVAALFTLEFVWRWKRAPKTYPKSAMAVVDLVAIIPFWIGFFVPTSWLGIIRTMRVFRLVKLFRYSRGLQLVALGFYRSFRQLKYLAFPVVIAVIFSTVAMYEAEHIAQPDAFDGLFNAFWFTTVTVTTVGYGDISPVTMPGKLIAMLTFLTVLSLFAGFIGVVGNAMSKVLDEEVDPDVDPISLFKMEQSSKENFSQ